MYRRMAAFYAVLAFLLAMLIIPALAFGADWLGVGPVYLDGHSGDSHYAVNNHGGQSLGFSAYLDKDMDWKWYAGEKTELGFNLTGFYQYGHWTRNFGDNGHYHTTDTVDSHVVGAGIQPYVSFWDRWTVFASGGPAFEAQVDHDNSYSPALFVEAGTKIRITDYLGVSLRQRWLFIDPNNEYKRFDATILALEVAL